MLIRVLIVALLILNVGVAVWWLARPDQPTGGQTTGAASADPSGDRIPRLVLADDTEAPDQAGRLVTTDAPGASVPAADAPTEDTCASHGPFATAEEAALAQRRASAPGVRAGVRAQAAGPYRGWKVWFPPFESLEQAQETAAKVAAAGFTDQFIVREGADAQSLALGRFGGEAQARQHAQKLIAAGFPARADPIGTGPISYWLDVSGLGSESARLRARIAAPQVVEVECTTWQ